MSHKFPWLLTPRIYVVDNHYLRILKKQHTSSYTPYFSQFPPRRAGGIHGYLRRSTDTAALLWHWRTNRPYDTYMLESQNNLAEFLS